MNLPEPCSEHDRRLQRRMVAEAKALGIDPELYVRHFYEPVPEADLIKARSRIFVKRGFLSGKTREEKRKAIYNLAARLQIGCNTPIDVDTPDCSFSGHNHTYNMIWVSKA